MRTITLEEHFVTPDFLQATSGLVEANPDIRAMQQKLVEIGDARIAAMDEAAVDLQVLSLAAIGFDKLEVAVATPLAASINDQLAAAVRRHPSRFAGFATLALKDPPSAAKELERSISQLGFKGLLISGTVGGKFLDDPQFTPVFETAHSLGIPIYLHPAPPPETVYNAYFTGLPGNTGDMLSRAGWGWHAENGLHALRLIVSGLLDRYPDLQIILGHMGENLPYFLARANTVLGSSAKHLQRSVADYFHQNFHITTSGFFTVPPLRCALEVVGIDRTIFSIDYPFAPLSRGRQFLDSLGNELSPADLEKLTHSNAERLLKL